MSRSQCVRILAGLGILITVFLVVAVRVVRAEDESVGDRYLIEAIERHELVEGSGIGEALLAQACYMREIRDGLVELTGKRKR